MTEQPAGWYPDPFAAVPGASRYWDGERWTSHAQAPAPQPQPAHSELAAPGRGFGWEQPSAGRPDDSPEAFGTGEARAPLASWGRRVAAYLLDAIPMVVLTMLLLQMLGVTEALTSAIEADGTAGIDEANAMLTALSPTGMTITLANLLFAALYNIGFHVSRGATPGKMLLGIRVRQVEQDRNPELRQASIRWLVQFGPGMLNGVPVIGMLSGFFSIADHLWPIWDADSQALHDKAGRTLVVRSR
ncbi:RDD family protein [Agrococcus sp. ProA11]|uniref:RDD family protein n=1 Tax=Agrococcus chionoecetis TaxID=3153752 RepID=UPI0032602352